MQINNNNNRFYRLYLIGFFLILALPILVIPPYFFPTDWGKTIVFRSILSILLLLFAYQLLYKRNGLSFPNIKKKKIVWILALFFIIILLATLFSQDINFSLWGSPYRAEGAVDFFFYIIFGVLSFLIIKPSDWSKILNFSIFIGILVCFVAVIQFYSLFNNIFIPIPGRPTGTMGNPIMLGIYLILLFFITLSSLIKEKRVAYRGFYIFAILLFFLTILITGSRAAWLGLIFGGTYFFLFYPAKNKGVIALKVSFAIILILGVLMIYYANSQKSLPQFLEKNRIFQSVQSRLSIQEALADPRFSAWQVVVKEIKEKPIFGWGPENLAIGFDKYYDPSLPYISKQWGGWWDRAHNIVLDTAATFGIPAVIIYLTLLILLFWQLQKSKKNRQQLSEINESPIIYHGLQATLVAYFTTNLLSFDGFSTYLLFYFIIGYSLYLTSLKNNEAANEKTQKQTKGRGVIMGILLILLIIFLWQYNILPLLINEQINKSDNLADNKKCNTALSVAKDNISKSHSFLDAYAVTHYVDAIKQCADVNPDKNLEYAKDGVQAMKEAVKIMPLYSRFWIFLGSFTNIIAQQEPDIKTKESLLNEANSYFAEASKLAPNHQEILIEQAKTFMVASDYQAMKENAEKCIELDSSLGECYWTGALAEIYLKDLEAAKGDLEVAYYKGFESGSISSLNQLASAYAAAKSYPELALTYEKLIALNPNVAQYHSSLAFTYAQLGQYTKAREQALIFLKLMPEEKDEVNAFLNTLPY